VVWVACLSAFISRCECGSTVCVGLKMCVLMHVNAGMGEASTSFEAQTIIKVMEETWIETWGEETT
jgi:hypothetical protein